MSNKIVVDIPGFGKRECSDDVDFYVYNLDTNTKCYYHCFKKGTNIFHNEYGPAIEDQDGSYRYVLNGNLHNINGPSSYDSLNHRELYHINGKFIGTSRKHLEQFLKTYNNPQVSARMDKIECPCGIYKNMCDYHK